MHHIPRLQNAIWKMVSFLPIRWRLSARVRLIKLRISRFEEEWHQLHLLGPNFGVALDIGANRGYYAFKLAGLYERVFAFEPNEDVTMELAAWAHPRIQLERIALSSSSGLSTLFIPITETGELLDGWASLNSEDYSAKHGVRGLKICTAALDTLGLKNVTFMKIDVEGHELEVLHGAFNLLVEQRPTVLIEIRKKNFPQVSSFLKTVGLHEVAPKCARHDGNEMHLFVSDHTLC